jgi:16S rRNA (adenine(1408)-N(1))-methyltransferase
VVLDIGTGDGRAVVARASAEAAELVIGVDAAAASMAEASRRAERRGPPNALFLAAGAEALGSTPLAGQADLVTITFPWGSLLRGVLGLDDPVLCGVAATLKHDGRIAVLASVVPTDTVEGLDRLDAAAAPAIAAAWRAAGLRLDSVRQATPTDLAAARSSWARRLGPDRPVWRLEGVRDDSIAR